MAQKWNLQDIRPNDPAGQPPRKQPALKKAGIDIAPRQPQPRPTQSFDDSDLATIDVIDGKKVKRNRVIVTAIVGVLIIAAGVGTNIMLGGADVTVTPKSKNISVQADFSAHTKPQANQLGYELLALEASGEKQVKATGKENVSQKAEGKIFIFNAKSTAPQALVKNTRFESKEGLIYRIKESVEVPGAKKDAQGNLVPGSIVANVIADGPGEQYNIEPARFTVPGLKGSEQYDSVYGESSAPFTGGFEGEKYIIDEKELDTAKQALHIELREKLLNDLKEKRPAGFVLYDDSVTLTFESLPATEYGESLATIKEVGRIKVPMFKEDQLAQFLAKNTIPEYTGDPVTLSDPKALTFSYKAATTTVSDISSYETLDFMLKGTTKVIWKFDQDKLKSELLGKSETEALEIFKKYNSIKNVASEIRPFWSSSFPNDPKQIEVHTNLEDSGEKAN